MLAVKVCNSERKGTRCFEDQPRLVTCDVFRSYLFAVLAEVLQGLPGSSDDVLVRVLEPRRYIL